MEYDNESLLMGNSIRVPELDEEVNDQVEEKSERDYLFAEIVNSIGTDKFKEVYTALMPEIRENYKDSQRDLCVMILKKISEVYEYDAPYKFDTYDDKFIMFTYDFVEFLEMKNINFLTLIWYYLGKEPRKINIEDYCKDSATHIDEIINREIDAIDYYEMTIVFLRTYDKIVDFIIKKTNDMKMIVVLRVLERRSL